MIFNAVFFRFFICLIIGYIIGYLNKNLSFKLSKPLILWGVPILISATLLGQGIDEKIFFGGLTGLIYLLSQVIIISIKNKNQNDLHIYLSAIIGNTGYLGLPISILFLPNNFIIYAIGFDIGSMIVTWGFLPLLINKIYKKKEYLEKKFFINTLICSPALRGILFFYLLRKFFKFQFLINSINFISILISIFALIYVGICMGELSKKYSYNFFREDIRIELIFYKLFISPFLMFLICLCFLIDQNISKALIIQSAMPTAISTLLLSEYFGLEKKQIASMIISTTFLSLISLPLINLFT
jgi:hypothetical protein